MNCNEILETFNRIARNANAKEKQAILAQALKDPQFRFVVLAAVDPMITYGMASIPDNAESSGTKDLFDGWDGSGWAGNDVTRTLDRMRKRSLTGSAATEAISAIINAHSASSRIILARIIQRDLRCAVTSTLVNKCEPGLVKTFECMLAHPFEPKRVKSWPQLVEPKIDGVRSLTFISRGTVKTFSRSGKEFSSTGHLNSILEEHYIWLADRVANGEAHHSLVDHYSYAFGNSDDSGIVIDGELETGSFNDTVSSARKKNGKDENLAIRMFDILPMRLFQRSDWAVPTHMRRQALVAFSQGLPADKFKLIDQYSVNSVAEIQQYYGKVRDRGMEGLIVKAPDGVYQRKRSYAWMKMKNEETLDLRIVGSFEGQGKYENTLGGHIVDCDGVLVSVGGGFKDAERHKAWEEWTAYTDGWVNINPLPDSDPQIAWILLNFGRDERLIQAVSWARKNPTIVSPVINRLIEVEFHEKTPDGSLRHPRFVRYRDDKPLDEVDVAAE